MGAASTSSRGEQGGPDGLQGGQCLQGALRLARKVLAEACPLQKCRRQCKEEGPKSDAGFTC